MKKFYDVVDGTFTLDPKAFMNTVSACYKQMSETAVKVIETHHKMFHNVAITMAEQQRKQLDAILEQATSFQLTVAENETLQKIVEKYASMKQLDYFGMLEEVKKFFMSKDGYKN